MGRFLYETAHFKCFFAKFSFFCRGGGSANFRRRRTGCADLSCQPITLCACAHIRKRKKDPVFSAADVKFTDFGAYCNKTRRGRGGGNMMQGKRKAFLCLAPAVCLYLLLCGFAAPRFPNNTSVGGTDIGGMTVSAALAAVRADVAAEMADKAFTVRAGGETYIFRYPELHCETNVREVLRRARRGGAFGLEKKYRITALDATLRGICDRFYERSADAKLEFTPNEREPFRFTAERAGRYLDGAALKQAVEEALDGGVWEVFAEPQEERPAFTEQRARQSAYLLSSFTTYYSAENAPRAHNIALAAEKLNGTVLETGEILSFNKRVGPRTAKNGFKEAPIIKAGEYVPGLGGGVCQASTTLYNAALLAGLEVREYHPHSLAVGYVEPSFDAMVSGSNCDLKLKNTLAGKVYIVCRTGQGWLNVRVYGQRSSVTYVRESVVTATVPPPAPEVREGAEDAEIRAAKNGLKSEGYLIRREAGKPDTRVRLRKDSYAPVQGILVRRAEEDEGKLQEIENIDKNFVTESS